MSVKLVDYVLKSANAKGSALLVLVGLAECARDDGRCYPGIPTIAQRARLSERQARRAVAELIQAGELRIIQKGGGRKANGAGFSNGYLLTGAAKAGVDTLTPVTGYERAGVNGNPVTDDLEPGHPRRHTPTPVAKNPVTHDRGTVDQNRKPNRRPEPKARRGHRNDACAVAIPVMLNTPEFLKAWSNWISDRKERGKRLTSRAASMQLNKMAAWGPVKAVESIEMSITNGWAGLFEPKERAARNSRSEDPSRAHSEPGTWEGQ